MERIVYRKTLDVYKNGVQFMLQGFETADNMSRIIEISLMASGDAIDFPLEKIEALMYVTTPNASEPSINKCTIKDNRVVYDVLPIVEEGITTMQLKIIETSTNGATGILASPKFAVEVTKSVANDENAEQTTTFTALEDAVAKAKAVYDERFLRMELTSDCLFRAYYADGTYYETDLLKRIFHEGNSLLSESFAKGGTGIRTGEDTDNSMYYSNVSKSEALNAKSIMENSEEILEEVKLHGIYTAFSVDFETGKVEYVSPSFKFSINLETGELDATGQTYSFEDEIDRAVIEWLSANGVNFSKLQDISSTHTEAISDLKKDVDALKDEDEELRDCIDEVKDRVVPIKLGGTGATTAEEALQNLGVANKLKALNALPIMVRRDENGVMKTTEKTILDAVGPYTYSGYLEVDTTNPIWEREEVLSSNMQFDLEGEQPILSMDINYTGCRGGSTNATDAIPTISFIDETGNFSKKVTLDDVHLNSTPSLRTKSIELSEEEVAYLYANNPKLLVKFKTSFELGTSTNRNSGYIEDITIESVSVKIYPAQRYHI